MTTTNNLSSHHAAMLIASAISAEVAEGRGYRTVTTKAELRQLGFGEAQAIVPTLVMPIWNVNGECALRHHRPDAPRQRNGKPAKYELPAGAKMVVDVHPFLREKVRDPNTFLIITEGVKKADAAVSAGLCCLALVGVWNWRGTNEWGGKTALPDWDGIAFRGQNSAPRQVYLCFDSDVMLKPSVHQALSRLSAFLKQRGASVAYIYLPHGEDGQKLGLDDYLAAGHTSDDLLALATSELRPAPQSDENTSPRKPPSVTEQLIKIARACELFQSERGEAFASLPVHNHREVRPIRSSAFKDWLRHEFYQKTKCAPNAQAMQDAVQQMEAACRYSDSPTLPLNPRVARQGEEVWLDLGDNLWRAVRVRADGWAVVDTPPILFRRYAPTAPQALPEAGGTVEWLRPFINVRDDNAWYQLIAWLVAAFIPDIPHPVLVIHGEQGSAKSTTASLLSALVDPSRIPLRSEPRDSDQWVQAADHAWLVTLDNVSHLPIWLSDAICRAVTGEGFSKRQLYTDSDDVILSFQRVVVLTGIEIVAERSDLLDRALLLPLSPITPERRRLEKEVLADFEALRPRIVGALLSTLAGVLRVLPGVRLERMPRMADFARIGVAVEKVLGWPDGVFLSAYATNIKEQHEEALGASVIGEAIQKLMAKQSQWEGTAGDLLEDLAGHAGEAITKQRGWPADARRLSGHIKRLSPDLRATGVDVKTTRKSHKRLITLTKKDAQNSVTSVTSVTSLLPEGESVTQNEPPVTLDTPAVTLAHHTTEKGDAADGESVPLSVSAQDLRTFRQGIYAADKDGTFTFEGQEYNVREVRTATRDSDALIKEWIASQRVG